MNIQLHLITQKLLPPTNRKKRFNGQLRIFTVKNLFHAEKSLTFIWKTTTTGVQHFSFQLILLMTSNSRYYDWAWIFPPLQ